jgi:hypothetical protein
MEEYSTIKKHGGKKFTFISRLHLYFQTILP